MATIDALLDELEHESQATARVLARVPDAHLTWRPHPKSMSLGQLALHVATLSGNVAEIAARDVSPPSTFIHPEPRTAGELAPALVASVAKGRRHLGGLDDAAMGPRTRTRSRPGDTVGVGARAGGSRRGISSTSGRWSRSPPRALASQDPGSATPKADGRGGAAILPGACASRQRRSWSSAAPTPT